MTGLGRQNLQRQMSVTEAGAGWELREKRYLIFFIGPKANHANGFRCLRVESEQMCKWQTVCTASDAICLGSDSKARQV